MKRLKAFLVTLALAVQIYVRVVYVAFRKLIRLATKDREPTFLGRVVLASRVLGIVGLIIALLLLPILFFPIASVVIALMICGLRQ